MNLALFQFSSQLIVEGTAKSTFRVGDDGVTSIELLAGGVIVIRREGAEAQLPIVVTSTGYGIGAPFVEKVYYDPDQEDFRKNAPKPPVKAKR